MSEQEHDKHSNTNARFLKVTVVEEIEPIVILRALIPPIFWRFRPRQSMKVYDSYNHALMDSHGYEDPGVVEVVSKKTEAHRNGLLAGNGEVSHRQTVQNMFILAHVLGDRPLEVLEIGGACGGTYFEMSHFLPGIIGSWRVVETPAMAAAGRKMFEDGRLSFYDSLGEAVSDFHPDLLMAQGVLQYLRDPLQSLEMWLEGRFANVYLTRTLVGLDIRGPIITKQVSELSKHGPGSAPRGFIERKMSQPLTIVPLESIISRISVGYNTVLRFTEGKSQPMLLGSRTITARKVGFLLRADENK